MTAASAGVARASRPAAATVRRRLRTATLFALMVVIAVVMLYPFYYILNNAFRTQTQF